MKQGCALVLIFLFPLLTNTINTNEGLLDFHTSLSDEVTARKK